MSDLRAALENLIQVLLQSGDEGVAIPSRSSFEFVDRGGGQVELPAIERPSWGEVAGALLPDYPNLDEFRIAAQAVSDALRLEATDSPARSALEAFLASYFEEAGGASWGEAAIDRATESFEEFLRSVEVDLLLLAPVQGLRDESGEINIADGVRLCPLTPDDRQAIWSKIGVGHGSFGLVVTPSEIAEWTHSLQATVFAKPFEFPNWVPGQDLLDQATDALALVSSEPVALKCILMTPGHRFSRYTARTPSIGAVSWGPESHVPFTSNGPLINGGAQMLPKLFPRIREARADHTFALAARRLREAFRRRNPEDAVIDYWIALESLFLPEVDELSNPAAIRISRFLGAERDERQRLFTLLRQSYALRSAVVHGVREGTGARKKYDLAETTRQTRSVLQAALRRWLDPAVDHSVEVIDLSVFD